MQRTWWLLWKPFWKIRNFVVCFFIYPFLDLFNLLKQKSHRWLCEKIGFQSRFEKKSKWCYSNQCKCLLIILNKIYASENIDIFRKKISKSMYYLNYPPCANSLVRNSQRSLPRKILTGEHRSELFWQKMSVFHR